MQPSLIPGQGPSDDAAGRRRGPRRRALGVGVVVVVLLVAAGVVFLIGSRAGSGGPAPAPSPPSAGGSPGSGTTGPGVTGPGAAGRSWTVAPSGQYGDGSAAHPLVGLQAGLDAAQPGDTVVVLPGTYAGPVHTVRGGLPGRPITITAQPGALLRGASVTTGRLFTVTHSWIVVAGFDIGNGNKGFWLEGVSHVVLRGNRVHDIGGECVRIKYLSSVVEVAGNSIGPCGDTNFDLESSRRNGEGVYIGTAPDQLARNPTDVPDATNQVWVHDNVIRPRAECVDIKEHALRNIIERNDCAGGADPNGSGLSARGNDNIIRTNSVRSFVGKGIRLGGDSSGQGVGNDVYGNSVIVTGDYGIGIMREPQGRVCGNTLRDNDSGEVNVSDVRPADKCP